MKPKRSLMTCAALTAILFVGLMPCALAQKAGVKAPQDMFESVQKLEDQGLSQLKSGKNTQARVSFEKAAGAAQNYLGRYTRERTAEYVRTSFRIGLYYELAGNKAFAEKYYRDTLGHLQKSAGKSGKLADTVRWDNDLLVNVVQQRLKTLTVPVQVQQRPITVIQRVE
jgi:hypothetical protein